MKRWLLPATAAALACGVYVNALNNPFVYDDHDTVVANPSLVDLSNIKLIFLYSPFRPIVNISYAIDRALWGDRPLGFHLTNVLLHTLVVLLVYALARRVLADARLERGSTAAGFAAAALFAVHPIQTEAVAYVSGRSELLCALWFLASMLAAREALVRRSPALAALTAVFAVLALASKEVALVLPLVMLAYVVVLDPEQRRRSRSPLGAAAFLIVVVAASYRVLMMRGAAVSATAALLNLMTEGIVIWRYVRLLALPLGQSIMHGTHRVTSFSDPAGWAALAALAVLVVVAWVLRRRASAVAFGILWFLLVLAPSSSIIPLAEPMAEHRVYLASAGIFIAIAGALAAAASAPQRRSAALPAKYMAAAAAVITVLSVLTVMRNRVWGSPIALWAEAVVHAEGMWEPHYALADALRDAGNYGAAVPEYKKVVDLSPAHRDAYVNLGICLAQTGQLEEAGRAFRQALAIDPKFVRGYTNLGALALLQGDAEGARDFYREAIAQDQDNVLARIQLASLYEHTFHDYHAAARMCGEARAIAPATPGVAECVERNQQLAAAKDRGR